MRVFRFEKFLHGILAPTDAITKVETFADAGYKDKPCGLVVTFANSSRVFLQFVGATRPGGEDYTAPEQPVEKEAPAPVAAPALTVDGGRVSMPDFEQHLRAVILNSGSREIAGVKSYSRGEGSTVHPYGLSVTFHSGANVFILFVHTVPAGREIQPDAEFRPLEKV